MNRIQGDGTVKTNRYPLLTTAVLALWACQVTLCGCDRGAAKRAPAENKARVQVEKIQTADMAETVKLNGEVAAVATVVLTPKVPGRLEQLAVQDETGKTVPLVEGTRVKAGQPLGVIDLATYVARERQAQAAMALANAQVEDAAREEQRVLALFKEGAATEQMRDKATVGHKVSEAALSQAQAALDLARIDLDESTLKAPIAGVVTAKHIDAGNIVGPGAPLVTIQDVSQVKVVFCLPERALPQVQSGRTPVTIVADALGATPVTGVVTRLYPAVDKATRTITAEVLLANDDGRWRPGMFVRVEVETQRKTGVPVVPALAVLRSGEGTYAFAVREAQAVRCPLDLGILRAERYEVRQGLKAGDVVVVVGQRLLRDGQPVEIVREEAP